VAVDQLNIQRKIRGHVLLRIVELDRIAGANAKTTLPQRGQSDLTGGSRSHLIHSWARAGLLDGECVALDPILDPAGCDPRVSDTSLSRREGQAEVTRRFRTT